MEDWISTASSLTSSSCPMYSDRSVGFQFVFWIVMRTISSKEKCHPWGWPRDDERDLRVGSAYFSALGERIYLSFDVAKLPHFLLLFILEFADGSVQALDLSCL